ncbi:hypothetical protein OKW45_002703 [Paraburkholderia sp. WSM4175]
MLDMAKRAALPWDAILGAEVVRAYKPSPQVYVETVEILGLDAASVCTVAAHNGDLAAARRCGLKTAFVATPTEHGPAQKSDLHAEQAWDFAATQMSVVSRKEAGPRVTDLYEGYGVSRCQLDKQVQLASLAKRSVTRSIPALLPVRRCCRRSQQPP